MSVQEKEQETQGSQDTKDVPVLQVDESLTMQERFTDNTLDNILPARYLTKDEEGEVDEDPDEMFHRVADNVATAEYAFDNEEEFEQWRDEFYRQMTEQRFMPNSPTLMNAGARLQQLSACFVDSPQDDLENIANTEKEWTMVQKTGGGMGGSFSDLRPQGALISSTKGTTSGPVSFMKKFNLVAGVIKQGGVRRGAQMAELRADHPDIGRFAVCKRNEGDFDNFNISVAVTDEFLDAVRDDDIYTLYSPQSNFEEAFEMVEDTVQFYAPQYQDYPEGHGPGQVPENLWRDYADDISAWDWENEETVSFRVKWEDQFERAHESGKLQVGEGMELPARFIWDLMIDGAWRNGEPGLFHLDETNKKHSFPVDKNDDSEYVIKATNPCAEQPLMEYEACNLGHVNLSLVMREDAPTFDEWQESVDYTYQTELAAAQDYFFEAVDFEQLDNTINTGVRFLDNVIEMSEFPLEEIEEKVDNFRKIGLGVMGWAQMLYQMGLPYGEEESLQMARVVSSYIDRKATEASHDLAQERGNFGAWEDSKYADPTEYTEWFEEHTYKQASNHEDGYAMRNHNVTTVAPTGTTSMIADTSGGIEPVFSVANYKNVGGDIQGADMLVEFDKVFLKTLEANGLDVEAVKEQAFEQMESNNFEGVYGLDIPEWMKETFVTSGELTAREHGLMQRAFQEGVDSGISKTVNLPKHATHKDVHDAYMLACDEDEIGSVIKGLTVYRDQSREEQVITTQKHSDKELERYQEALEEAGFEVEEPED